MDDREDNKKDEFLYQGGIIEFVKMLNKNKTPLHDDVIYVEGREDNILIEVAMQYNNSYNEKGYQKFRKKFITNLNGGSTKELIQLIEENL